MMDRVKKEEGDGDDHNDDYATVGSVVWIGRPLIITVLVGPMSVLLMWPLARW